MSARTRAKDAEPPPSEPTWPATAASTRSAPGPLDPQAGVQRGDEGGRAGGVDPQQAAAAAGDDGVSGEDFTAVGHDAPA